MEDNDDLDFVASEHDRLVSAITKLDKTQHITEPSRSEPTNVNSEFNLIKRSNKLKLNNVVKVLEDTAHNVQISKKLKESHNVSRVLPKPLEKPQAERIKRATGYEQTKKKVGRWDPVVARNRTVDFVSFPLKSVSSKVHPTKEFLSRMELKSSLEKELEEIDPQPAIEEIEDQQTYPMSYHEMLEQRRHLAKLRAQQSYTAAKAKRQSKIKSKKYHRILKKAKLKQQIKEFEELQNNNPEEALKKLEELEKARALERHTLRHKNTGKWAKSKLVRAKYDKEVRQQLSEQLSVSKSLTHKVQNTESTDDEADETENIPDITLAQDPKNPWMMKRSDKTNIDAEFNFGYKKYLKDKMYKRKEDSDSDSDQEKSNEEKIDVSLMILKENINQLANIESKNLDNDRNKIENLTDLDRTETDQNQTLPKKKIANKRKTQLVKNKATKVVATSQWQIDTIEPSLFKKSDNPKSIDVNEAFDNLEQKLAGRVAKKLERLKNSIRKQENKSEKGTSKSDKKSQEKDNLEYLKLKNQKLKPIIDEELLETHKGIDSIKDKPTPINVRDLLSTTGNREQENSNVNIDPSRYIEVKPKYLATAVSKGLNDFDDLDDEEQVVPKVNIDEVFEEDDVVASFRQEKQDEINNDTPKDIDLTLPGWGKWGGKGVKAPKRKHNRFILKAAPKMPRRDENKGDIIINEFKNPKLISHKVSDLPFPFTSVKEYEATVRTPIGNTFIPETAHKQLIRPSVITRAGTVIEPMNEDELLVKRNLTFKDESIIKLLGKQ